MIGEFDQVIERCGTNSLKWDARQARFGREDVIPLWVADMDFRSPQAVIEALQRRVEHGIFGYAARLDSYYAAVQGWLAERHGWQVEKEWLVHSPGVVPALYGLVRALTEPGDKVMLQSPVYAPFFKAVESSGRTLVNNRLQLSAGRYAMDLEDLETQIDDRVKMVFLCSPHNPVGRVWTREELIRLREICVKYQLILVADEIHADLVYPGFKHTCFGTIAGELLSNLVVCTAPSKTFNLAGLQIANVIIPNPELRRAFERAMEHAGIAEPNVLGLVAAEAAYGHGAGWLDELIGYLHGNLNYVKKFVAAQIPELSIIEPEGTYLVWLDCRKLGLESRALREFMVTKAKVALNDGFAFGPGGEGFMRINIACPRVTLVEAMERIAAAISQRSS